MHLMRNRGHLAGGFCSACLGDGSRRHGPTDLELLGRPVEGRTRGGKLFGSKRQRMLNRLKLADRTAELYPCAGPFDCHGHCTHHRAGQHRSASERKKSLHHRCLGRTHRAARCCASRR